MIYVEPEIQKRIIHLFFAERRTQKSLADEFGLSPSVIRRIMDSYKREARETSEKAQKWADMEELSRLKKENDELKKENDFLKKRRRSLRRGAIKEVPFYR